MHGAVHDYITLKTVKGGETFQTGETHDRFNVGEVQKEKPLGRLKSPTVQPTFDRLLEIGSLDLIGSMRTFDFMGTGPLWSSILGIKEYVGIDLMEGKSVDIVMNAHDLKFEDESFDIVMCLQMLEHDSDPRKTLKEAHRVLKPGQPFILTCASADHPEHADLGGGSTAYVHITIEDLRRWLEQAGFDLGEVEVTTQDNNFFVYAVKGKPKKAGKKSSK